MAILLMKRKDIRLPAKNNILNKLVWLYKLGYILIGITAIGYYTNLTFNKYQFARRHDAGIWQPELEWHFFRIRNTYRARIHKDSTVYSKASYILSKYD
jgi:hypothetical protein